MACSALAVLLAVTSASVSGRPGEKAPRGPSPGQPAAASKRQQRDNLASRDFQLNINATQVVEKMARQSNQVAVAVAAIRANTKCGRSRAPRPVVPFRGRADLAYQLERDFPHGRGCELGVQRGVFSAQILERWTSCARYHLVDLWSQQPNYKDKANVNNNEQQQRYEETMLAVKPYKLRGTEVTSCRNYTNACAALWARPESLDFIYVDARHDYLGALQDMLLWWPLLRCGGIMAGHDYVTQEEVSRMSPKVKQDWTKNFDGTVDETRRVLKGAADDFSSFINRQLTISYQEGAWHTWAVRK